MTARLVVLLWLVLGLVGCEERTEAPAPAPAVLASAVAATPVAQSQRLVRAIMNDPMTFNPVLVTDSLSSQVLDDVFEPLVRLNPKTTEMEPMLAERWEMNPAGTQCTFHLRTGVRWHDGKPFTARDVVFTFSAVFDDRVPNSTKHTLTINGQPLKVEAVDDHTVRMTLPQPFAPFLYSVSTQIVPEHILGESLKKGTFAQEWGIDTPPQKLIGTGPYRIVQYEQAQFVRYQRNADYWMRDDSGQALPYVRDRVFRIVPNQDTMYLKFLAGETDILWPRPEEIAALNAKQSSGSITVTEVGLDSGTLFVTFNRNPRHYEQNGKHDPRLEWFTDTRFLRAMAHAIDKQAMTLNCLSGYGVAAVGEISPANQRFYDSHIQDYRYDLAEARRLLDDGGYLDRDGDGQREDRDGHPIEFSLYTNAGNQLREKMCAMLQEDWRKLGMKVHYQPLDFPTLVEKLDTSFDWDVVLIGFTGGVDPHNGANVLRSSGNLHMWNPSQKEPATDWERQIDELVDRGARELDLDKRRQVYWDIERILHEQLPMIQTVHQRQFVAYRDTLQNYAPFVWGVYRPERIRIAE